MHPVFCDILESLDGGKRTDSLFEAELNDTMTDVHLIARVHFDKTNKISNICLLKWACDAIAIQNVANKFDTDGICMAVGINSREFKSEKENGKNDKKTLILTCKTSGDKFNTQEKATLDMVSQHCFPWMLAEIQMG